MGEDYEPRYPQDALDGDDADIDPITLEESEDITEQLHTDPHDRQERMDANEDPASEQSEDYREDVEDRDQET